jgi:hypothetical protein
MEKTLEKEQTCQVCGCHIGRDAYKKNEVLYCYHACAERGQYECGCCTITLF